LIEQRILEGLFHHRGTRLRKGYGAAGGHTRDKNIFPLPGDGKRKPSALTAKMLPCFSNRLPFALFIASLSVVLFAHRRLPMGKK
jgi:hypothetical protein